MKMNESYILIFLLFGGLIGVLVDPRTSMRNKLIYWLVPPIVGYLGFLVLQRNPGGALLSGAVVLVLMGVTWIRYYRPGPGKFNK